VHGQDDSPTPCGGDDGGVITRVGDGGQHRTSRKSSMPFALPVARVTRPRQRLRDEHHLLGVLLESVEVALIACAVDGRLTHVNRRTRELLGGECSAGMDVATWIGRLAPRTSSGLPLVLEDLPLMRALEGEAVRDVDVLLASAAGDVLLSTSANPVNDERGRRRGAVAVFADVTEQRAREAQMRAAQRASEPSP
jgi:PAS domain-containing protein